MGDSANRRRDETGFPGLREMFKRAVVERLRLVEIAAVAVRFGRLDEATRARAERAAHKIADAARMYGYWDAAQFALELQAAFKGSEPIAPSMLARIFEIIEELRAELSA